MTQVKILNNERVILLGTTGSGKTVLAKRFLMSLNRVLVIDPKHTFKLDGFKRTKEVPLFTHNFRMIYRPTRDDDLHLADLIWKLNKQKHVTIYVDELSSLAESPFFKNTVTELMDIARTGRERHVALWASVQRPRRTPRIFFSEAEVFFQFKLKSGEDREYISEFIGDIVRRPIPLHQFWYSRSDEDSDRPSLLKLDLSKNKILAMAVVLPFIPP
jgi:ABC-type dipeptide/oligopeptide/nickel transport system ATPase component